MKNDGMLKFGTCECPNFENNYLFFQLKAIPHATIVSSQ